MCNIKLIKGDCLEKFTLIKDKSIDLVFTDLPYGTTACEWDVVIPFDKLWEINNKISKRNAPFVSFATEPFASLLRCSNLKDYKYDWIWDKEQGTNQFLKDKQPLRKHENICVFYKEQSKFNKVPVKSWRREIKFRQETNFSIVGYESKEKTSYDSKGFKHPVSILPFNRPHWREGRYHETQKPILLCNYIIQTYTDENEIVCDLTMGSASISISCIQLNRNYIGIEKDENKFNIAANRINTYIKDNNLGNVNVEIESV